MLLPSGKVVDRTTIAHHLLSNETDPFSRQKLTIDQVKDAVEVKAQIVAYRAAKRQEALASKQAAADGGGAPMDTDE